MLRRYARQMVVIGAILFGFVAMSAPAQAAAGDTVTAVVTGTTRVTATPDLLVPSTHGGSFDDVAITGVFVATDGDVPLVYAGTVTAGSITFTTTETLLQGRGTINPGNFSGTNGVCSIEGNISNGDFERVGTLALASLDIRYEVECLGESAEGEVSAQVVVTAVPGAGNPPGDLADSLIAGTVVGEGTDTVPDVGRIVP